MRKLNASLAVLKKSDAVISHSHLPFTPKITLIGKLRAQLPVVWLVHEASRDTTRQQPPSAFAAAQTA
jgi:hypothetical protein